MAEPVGGAPSVGSAPEDVPADQAPAMQETTTTAVPYFDISQISVAIAGCDSDRLGNARIGGYAINNATTPAPKITFAALLDAADGSTVAGGNKTFYLECIMPGETRKFTIDFASPSTWKSCRVYVLDRNTTQQPNT
jgi:hypothetical protein